MDRQRRPTKLQIVKYWMSEEGINQWPKIKTNNLTINDAKCFACGFTTDRWKQNKYRNAWDASGLERAHIVPAILGGTFEPSNFVLICKECHRKAPNVIEREFFYRWVLERKDWRIQRFEEILIELNHMGVDFDQLSASQIISFIFVIRNSDPKKIGLHNNLTFGPIITASSIAAILYEWHTKTHQLINNASEIKRASGIYLDACSFETKYNINFKQYISEINSSIEELTKKIISLATCKGIGKIHQKMLKAGGRVPYGFDVNQVGDKKYIIVNYREQEIIQEMVKMQKEGYSFGKIAENLTKQNIKTKTQQSIWTASTVRGILTRVSNEVTLDEPQ